jgi:filamentous hemagglutinin family protein
MHAPQKVLLALTLAPMAIGPAWAGPNGGTVVNGNVTIQGQNTNSVSITQSSQNAIINWQTFNIGAGETVQISMPNASSTELERVIGNFVPSQINGSLSSNGRVFLVNPDGILFGMGAEVNVGSLLATTHDVSNANFMAGRYNFNISGNPRASIVNQGRITAQAGGFAALVAPGVRNTGTITAWLGRVGLASANSFSLDLYGDRLIQLNVNDFDRRAGDRRLHRQAAEIAGQQRRHAQGKRRTGRVERCRRPAGRRLRHQQFRRDRSQQHRHA